MPSSSVIIHFLDDVNLQMSERLDFAACSFLALLKLIHLVIALKNLSTLPKLASDLKSSEDHLPRYYGVRRNLPGKGGREVRQQKEKAKVTNEIEKYLQITYTNYLRQASAMLKFLRLR